MIALLTFRAEKPPQAQPIATVLANHFGAAARIESASNSPTVTLSLGPLEAVIAPGAGPIPNEVVEPALARAWYWPAARDTFADHLSHLAVIVKPSESSPKLRSLLLTRITALVGAAFDYTAVYYEPAGLVHSGAAFTESSRVMSEKELPLRLWIGFHLVANADGSHSLHTTGLEPLGLMELEVRQSRRPKENIYGWSFNIAHFLLEKGAVLKDGEAVGANPREWIRIYHLPSAIEPTRTVYFLDLDLDEELDAAQDSPSAERSADGF
ncbi:MAG: DUF4261 domain-containing protein [Planctomycetota bacterium]